jgi:hypothetical protein
VPTYVFMTGFQKYRIQAASREEALEVALRELQPDANTRAIIESTLYDEEEGKRFTDPSQKGGV